MSLEDSDHAVALLKEYIDTKIQKQIEEEFGKIHTALQTQINDVFRQMKEYVKMKVDSAQRDLQASMDTSMKAMWENVEKEIKRSKSLQSPCLSETNDDEPSIVLESAGEDSDKDKDLGSTDFLDLESKIESQYWGKSFGAETEAVSDDEESPKKAKLAKPKKAPARNSKGAGRPKGATNKTVTKTVLQKQKEELLRVNKALQEKLKRLDKK